MAMLRTDAVRYEKAEGRLVSLKQEIKGVEKTLSGLKQQIERRLNGSASPRQAAAPAIVRRGMKRKPVRKLKAGKRGGDGARGTRARRVILKALRASKKPVGGTALAKRARVSKMTVARQVEALRKRGYKIKGKRGVGYTLKK